MPDEGRTRTSTRPTTATEKRRAAGELAVIPCATIRMAHPGDADHVVDEGSEEQLKKKLKTLEDKIGKLAGTNAALTSTVKALQKEKVRHADDDRGGYDSSSDCEPEDSPLFFSARKVCARNFISFKTHLA